MRLSQAAAVTRGALRGADCVFERVVIDSRLVARGDLFVAIHGAHSDGHDFIDHASERGAVGALVSQPAMSKVGMSTVGMSKPRMPKTAQIQVDDTTAALGRLGAHWRGRFDLPLVAVTGSNGKTTVSALLASILNHGGDCLSPRASFNNHWGVPLTLLRMRRRHTHAVIEMGMNQAGEIAYLSGLAKPTIALINNVAPAHLQALVDLQGVADAKAEIFTGLARGGVKVFNADDRFGRESARCAEHALTFGIEPAARAGDLSPDVRAENIASDATGVSFQLNLRGRRAPIRLSLLGRHNVANAVAAAAAAHAAGADLPRIQAGLAAFTGIHGRLRRLRGVGGALIIDDSYNANPASVEAALDALAAFDGERIAVLGRMAELGAHSDRLHHAVGSHGRMRGIQRLMCFGPADDSGLAAYLTGFGGAAARFDSLAGLLGQLTPLLTGEATVLIKGSRSTGMERVVDRLRAADSAGSPATPAEGAAC